MEKKVIGVKNLKEEKFDMASVLKANSDCVLGYNGTYKTENGTMIKVDNKSEAELCVYYNMETGDMVKVPYDYIEIFENVIMYLVLKHLLLLQTLKNLKIKNL